MHVIFDYRFDDGEALMLEVDIGLHRDHEGLLVFRASTGLAAVAFATQVSIVDLHETAELARLFALHHRLYWLESRRPIFIVIGVSRKFIR